MAEKNTRPNARLKAINLGETFQVFYFGVLMLVCFSLFLFMFYLFFIFVLFVVFLFALSYLCVFILCN